MIKRIHSTLFYAHDLDRTARFYEDLGFDVEKGEDGVRIKLGDFRLAFIDENKTPIKNESNLTPKGLGIFTYVEVEDVNAYFQRLKEKNIKTSSEPRDWPWGKREFAIKDPDGYKLVFFSNIVR
jgi:catechol 2,3-dioxygenase-like lactoylglutathione lyase family enzyme